MGWKLKRSSRDDESGTMPFICTTWLLAIRLFVNQSESLSAKTPAPRPVKFAGSWLCVNWLEAIVQWIICPATVGASAIAPPNPFPDNDAVLCAPPMALLNENVLLRK